MTEIGIGGIWTRYLHLPRPFFLSHFCLAYNLVNVIFSCQKLIRTTNFSTSLA
jgi:hypothetical protein